MFTISILQYQQNQGIITFELTHLYQNYFKQKFAIQFNFRLMF